MRRAIVGLAVASLVALGAGPAALGAQMDAGMPMTHSHMSFSPARPGTPADTARVLGLLSGLRAAISPYQDLEAAQAAGFQARRDPQSVAAGKLLHVGRRVRVAGNAKGFDPGAPQALLYRRGEDGRMRLAGAMFVAPLSATEDDLDAMIPLSIARWHRHMNVCVAGDRRSVRRIARATTEEACTTSGGRFRAQSRYMVHVMTDAGSDLASAFPQHPADDADMHAGGEGH
jgi:hypothetical protein